MTLPPRSFAALGAIVLTLAPSALAHASPDFVALAKSYYNVSSLPESPGGCVLCHASDRGGLASAGQLRPFGALLHTQYAVSAHVGLRSALVAIDTQHAPIAAAIRAGQDPNPLAASAVPALGPGPVGLLAGALLAFGLALTGRRAARRIASVLLVVSAGVLWAAPARAQTSYFWATGAEAGGSSDPIDMGPSAGQVCVLWAIGGNFGSFVDSVAIRIDPSTGHYVLGGTNVSSALNASSAGAV
jgi:hypothetical protein